MWEAKNVGGITVTVCSVARENKKGLALTICKYLMRSLLFVCFGFLCVTPRVLVFVSLSGGCHFTGGSPTHTMIVRFSFLLKDQKIETDTITNKSIDTKMTGWFTCDEKPDANHTHATKLPKTFILNLM